MEFTLICFGSTKDFFPAKQTMDLPDIVTLKDLMKYLIRLEPKSQNLLQTCRFSLNQNIVNEDAKITYQSEIAILPPSSGG
jgi:molybdopterin converting factor small subunit